MLIAHFNKASLGNHQTPAAIKKTFVFSVIAAFLTALLGFSSVASAMGVKTFWTGSNSTLWSDGKNWAYAPGGAPINLTPSSYDEVVFPATNSANSSATVLGGNMSIKFLTINSSVPVGIGGGGYLEILNGSITTSSAAGNVLINAPLILKGPTILAIENQNTTIASLTATNNMIKQGNGVLNLSGPSTINGTTTVSAGTLNVNGSTSASSRFTVASGATLGGNGTIGGDATIYGIHSPGNSPGIQTFTGNLTYDTSGGNGPTVNWQLSGNTDTNFSAFDQIVVGGNLAFNTPTSLVLDFSGYGDVDWADPFWTTDQSWVIYDVAGTTTGANNFSIATANWADNSGDTFNTLLSGSAFSLSQQGNDLVLNYTAGTAAVPEPSQVAASLLALVGIGIYLWRRKHAAQTKHQHS